MIVSDNRYSAQVCICWTNKIFIPRPIGDLHVQCTYVRTVEVKFQVVVDREAWRSPTSTEYYIPYRWGLWIMHIFRDMSGWVMGWHVALTGCKLDTKNAPPLVLRHDSRVCTVTRVPVGRARFSRCIAILWPIAFLSSVLNLAAISSIFDSIMAFQLEKKHVSNLNKL